MPPAPCPRPHIGRRWRIRSKPPARGHRSHIQAKPAHQPTAPRVVERGSLGRGVLPVSRNVRHGRARRPARSRSTYSLGLIAGSPGSAPGVSPARNTPAPLPGVAIQDHAVRNVLCSYAAPRATMASRNFSGRSLQHDMATALMDGAVPKTTCQDRYQRAPAVDRLDRAVTAARFHRHLGFEPLNNIHEAASLFLGTWYEIGTLNQVLQERGVHRDRGRQADPYTISLTADDEHLTMMKPGAVRPIVMHSNPRTAKISRDRYLACGHALIAPDLGHMSPARLEQAPMATEPYDV